MCVCVGGGGGLGGWKGEEISEEDGVTSCTQSGFKTNTWNVSLSVTLLKCAVKRCD